MGLSIFNIAYWQNPYGLRDEFTTAQAAPIVSPRNCEPGPGQLVKNDASNNLSINSDGRLNCAGGSGSWDNPSVWSNALDGPTFGAVAALFSIRGDSNTGPALILHSAANVSPASAGRGLFYLQPDIKGATASLLLTDGARVASDYLLFAIVRRAGGGDYIAICGDAFGLFPTATLLWIDDTDTITTNAYIGISDKSGGWEAEHVHMITANDLPTALQTRYGASLAYDTFGGSGNISGRASEGGGLSWALKSGGSGTVGSGVASPAAGTYAIVSPASLPRITEVTITAPASGICDSWLIVRSSAAVAQAYYFRATKTGVDVYSDYTAGYVMQTGAYTIVNGQTYRLRCIDFGTLMRFYLDDVLVGTYSSTNGNSNFGCGFVRSSDDASASTFDNFACWSSTITLPTDLGPVSVAPVGTGSALVTDAFAGTNSTALSTYDSAWHTNGAGSWEINTNKARLTADAAVGYAYRDSTTSADHAPSIDVTTPNTTPTFPTDWYCGVVARWTDANNMLFARLLYQDNSNEIELRQANGGAGAVIGYYNFGTSGIAPNTTYTLTLACKGSEVAVYINGGGYTNKLVIRCKTAVLSGVNVGMGIESPASGRPTFDNFSVKAT